MIQRSDIAQEGTSAFRVVEGAWAIAQQLRNWLLTRPGQRVFRPFLGGGLEENLNTLGSVDEQNRILNKVVEGLDVVDPERVFDHRDITLEELPGENGIVVNLVVKNKSYGTGNVSIALEA